jgi:hypothetical protein
MNRRTAALSTTLAAAVAATPLAWSVLSPGATAAPARTAPVTARVTTPVTAPAAAPVGAPVAAAPEAEAGPPVLRVQDVLSTGSPRRNALFEAYTGCLLDKGAPTVQDERPVPDVGYNQARGVAIADPVPARIERACADLMPVYPPSLEAATNPDFAAQAASYVACLRSNGQWVRLLNDRDISWTYVAGHDVPDDNARIEDECLLANFSD